MIVIVDYGMGNLSSIKSMLHKVGAASVISSDPAIIDQAERLILPGVGAFDEAMHNLKTLGLIPVLNRKALEERVPVLGVCLGMQLVTRGSEEGTVPGLGWIEAEAKHFSFKDMSRDLKIPHMGWNTVTPTRSTSLFPDPDAKLRFYFVHSYHVVCDSDDNVLTTTHHGYTFASTIIRDNVVGMQYHPEKSHNFGLELYRRFLYDWP